MGGWDRHRVAVPLDTEASVELLAGLKAAGASVDGLLAFSGYSAPLRWGEAVPLSFFGGLLGGNDDGGGSGSGGDAVKAVVLSHDPGSTAARCAGAAARLPRTAAMGRAIGEWAAATSKRVFVLISADLAHVHGNQRCPATADGAPDRRYLNPKFGDAGTDPSAAPFEAAIRGWIEAVGRGDDRAATAALCTDALALLPSALSCGWEGFVMLHEMLKLVPAARRGPATVLAHEVPVYYGMLVATFAITEAAADGNSDSGGTAVAAAPKQTGQVPPAPSIASVAESFAGRVAAVSGAGHGFGREIALSLAAMGCRVYACDGPGQTAREELGVTVAAAAALPGGGTVATSVVDFAQEDAVRAWVAGMPRLDVLVLNAGGVLGRTQQPVEDVDMAGGGAIFAVNVRSSMVAAQAAAPMLRRSRCGRVVTISSGAGLRKSLTGIQAYCAAKHALVGLTKQLAHELGPAGVTVNSVAPGLCLTNPSSTRQWEGYSAEKQAQVMAGISVGRLGTAADIAAAVSFFASEAGWCSGQILEVNGGR